MTLSTHVLDTARGEPAVGVPVRLEAFTAAVPRRAQPEPVFGGGEHAPSSPGGGEWRGGAWREVARGVTDHDGRLRDWVAAGQWRAGAYRLVFDTAAYLGPAAFFPEVAVVFQVADPDRHHHVPLLLSPFGYSTYRGS